MTTDTLRQVFGTLRTPNGSPFPNKSLKWFRERRVTVSQGSSVVLDDPFIVTTDAQGDIDTAVMAGSYLVMAPLSDADRYFRVVVPDQAGPFDISSLIDGPTVEPDDLTQFEALVAKAKAWANAPEDSVVESGEFSAKHYAAKAEEERLGAQTAVDTAVAAALAKAEEWAENPEEVAVEPGQFSAKHWAAKSEEERVAAQVARGDAEAARDAAFVNADVYADTSAGLAGTTLGDQFLVVSGEEVIRYSHDAGPVATEVARYPAKSLVDEIRNQASVFQRIGRPATPVDGSAATGGTYVFGAPIKYDGTLYRVSVWANGASTIKVRRFSRSGTTLTQVGSDTNVAVVNGLNQVTVDMDVLAGEYIGFYHDNGKVKYNGFSDPDASYWGVSLTDSTSFSDATLENGLRWQIGFDIRQPFVTSARSAEVDDKITTRLPLVFNNNTLLPRPEVSANGGAVALTAPAVGYRIPVGQIGNGSFINFYAPLHDPEFAKYNGKRVRLSIYFETENYVERGYGVGKAGTAAAATELLGSSQFYDADRSRLIWTWDFIPNWTAGDATEQVKFFAQAGSISAAVSEIKITAVDQFWTPLEAVDPQPELPVMMREVIRQERVARQYLDGQGFTIVTANSDTGSGADFTGNTAIQDAIDSITDATADNQYEIRVTGTFVASATSDYTKLVDLIDTFIVTKDHVHLIGNGRVDLIGSVPDATPSKDLYDVLRHDGNCRVEGFYINGTNIRYGTHFETGGAKPNTSRIMKGGHIKSNLSAVIGFGGASGDVTFFEDIIFETGGSACFFMHDNRNFTQPMVTELRRCELRSGTVGVGRALQLQSLGSRLKSTIRLTDTTMPSGSVVAHVGPWLSTPLADHVGWNVVAPGHEPRAVQTSPLPHTVLRIVSDSTGASSEIILDETSSAFDVIFGDSSLTAEYEDDLWFTRQHGYQRKVGGVGLAGEAISGLDIGETDRGTNGGNYQGSLGKRLGDCSGTSKALVVNVDGTDRTITFDKNYDGTAATAAPNFTNTQILAEINTALSGHATASLVALGRYNYPLFKGNEVRSNSDSTAILKGMGVVFSGLRTARIATSADERIDGIALDDAAPGARFRLITCGEIFTQNSGEWFALREVSSTAHAVGTELGISTGVAGSFSAAGPNKVLRIVAAGVAAWL